MHLHALTCVWSHTWVHWRCTMMYPWSILESQGYFGYLDLELRSRMMLGLLVAWPSLSAGSAVFLARSTRNWIAQRRIKFASAFSFLDSANVLCGKRMDVINWLWKISLFFEQFIWPADWNKWLIWFDHVWLYDMKLCFSIKWWNQWSACQQPIHKSAGS